MAEDNTGAIAGGALDYQQLYPTMLPFLPPPEEAALRGEQQIHVAAADPTSIQVSTIALRACAGLVSLQ